MKTLVISALAVLGFVAAGAAQSQADFPVKPIRFVIPFAAGGPVDVLGRAVGQKVTAAWGQNVLLDNRAGAGGILAGELVAKSAPDGYTALLTSGNFTALSAFTKTLPYHPTRDFAPVSAVARIPGFILAVHPSLPARSVKEFVALAKASPAKLNYGSSGTGGVQHLAMELFNLAAGTKMTHVLYKGAAPLSVDLLSGQIETAFVVPSGAIDFIKTGRLRALGFSGSKRWSKMPDLPTVQEAGVKGYEFYTWYGLWYPAAVAPAIVNRLHAEVVKAVAAPDVRQRFDELGFEGMASASPAEFSKFVESDLAAMMKLSKQIGFQPQ